MSSRRGILGLIRSHDAAFAPSNLPGLKLWTRHNRGITITGSGVSQWDDASGEGNHLLQAVDAARPQKQLDGSILFDGLAHFLKAAAFTLVQPETIYILGKQVTWVNNGRVFDGNTENTLGLYQTSVTPDLLMYAGASGPVSSAWILNTYAVLSTVWNGASSLLQIDNGVASSGNAGAAAAAGFTLAANGANVGWSNIQVKEVLIYNIAHDAAQRAQVINYLQGL